jgi:hypothetical protein
MLQTVKDVGSFGDGFAKAVFAKNDYEAGRLAVKPVMTAMNLTAAVMGTRLGVEGASTPRGQVVTRDLHAEAEAARDNLATELAKQKHAPATVVGAYSESTGKVTAGTSRGRGLGCAEGVCDANLGYPGDTKFTTAVRPRTGEAVPVCPLCEAKYGRDAFPSNATFKSDQAPK